MDLSDLLVWNKSMDLADAIHKTTKRFPKDERYDLVSQMRRAALSVPSNIAEGSQRTSDRDFAHFISIAKGSLAELHTQLLLSERYGYLPAEKMKELCKIIDEIHRMLYALRKTLISHSF